MTQGCVITLTRGHISKVKIAVHTYPKSVSGPLPFIVKLDWDGDDLIVVHDTWVVVAGGGGFTMYLSRYDMSSFISNILECINDFK